MNKDDMIKAEILQAAKEVFQKWGVKKSTMEDIAAAAGKAKSTLYYYYKSKDEIFDEAVIAELSGILDRCKSAISGIPSAKEQIKTYVVSTLTEMKAYAMQYKLVWEELRSNQHFVKKLRRQVEVHEASFYQNILQRGFEQGEFSFATAAEVKAVANTIAGIVRALFMHLFLDSADSREIDIAAKLIANGL